MITLYVLMVFLVTMGCVSTDPQLAHDAASSVLTYWLTLVHDYGCCPVR